MFVVALVITMLMGIGVYATRSASLSTQASGYDRQSVQTKYVADYAIGLTAATLSDGAALSIINQATNFTQAKTQNCASQANLDTPNCYKLFYKEFSDQLVNFCDAVVAPSFTGSAPIPGSLGFGNVEPDFSVELTDISPASPPAGMPLNPGNQSPKFYYVTATATAQVRLKNTAAIGLDAPSAESSSTQSARALLVAGPFRLN